jgi:hypothetical protein
MQFLVWQILGFVGGVVYASFFEWVLHKYVMHRPLGKFEYPFRAHALVHHHIFRADESYHLRNVADKKTVPMAWWNGPLLILLHLPAMWAIGWLIGHPIVIGAASAMAVYYATYEYIHWCMHVPRTRNVERTGVFFRLNGHHLLHHRYMHKNFNVVIPLADLCLGSLLRRAPLKFAQATGPSVPNVQPLDAKKPAPELTLVA